MLEMPRETALAFFGEFFGGDHHVPIRTMKPWGFGWIIAIPAGEVASFDDDGMTRLVLLAHDRCIRVAVSPAGKHSLNLEIHPREGRTGGFTERHPTIEEVLTRWRITHAAVDAPPAPISQLAQDLRESATTHLTDSEKGNVNAAAAAIRGVLEIYGDPGKIALSLCAADFAAE